MRVEFKYRKIAMPLFGVLMLVACAGQTQDQAVEASALKVGAEKLEVILPLLNNKRIGIVANQSSLVGEKHLVDTLLDHKIRIQCVFAPEHGFRGFADAGEKIADDVDPKTGIHVISLYGNNKKPSEKDLANVDVVLFDIQDVGVRFYTYLSTLHYVMEACAELDIPLIVLDRPNPNGFYVDGPVLQKDQQSFVGLHPIPLVYGMNIGEYAQMINGEYWLKDSVQVDLTVVPCDNYDRMGEYELPVRPSPNLPNSTSIYLYPMLALFEGTVVSVGRGTDFPFQVVGHPEFPDHRFSFVPVSKPGAKFPKLQGETCYGIDLREFGSFYPRKTKQLYLFWLLGFYKKLPAKERFFLSNNFFNRLAGNRELMEQIKKGKSEEEIRVSWKADLDAFKKIRSKYLIYPEH